MSWSRRDSRMVRSAGVHEPQRERWLSTHRTESGSARPSSQVRLRAVARRIRSSSPGRRRASAFSTRATIVSTHSASWARLIRAGISTTIRSPSR